MRWLCNWALAAGCFAFPLQAADPLTIAYPERKPYHYTDEHGTPTGLLTDVLKKALVAAEIEARFVVMPTQRALALVRQTDPICSISWFKTPDRQPYARFSIPIWQDAPHVLVARAEHRDLLSRFSLMRDIHFDTPVRIGVIDNVSYGPFLDDIFRLQGRGFTLVKLVNNDANMYRMLDQGRFDLMVASELDLAAGLAAAELPTTHVAAQSYPDIPPGGKRRMMCSKAVDAALIDRLDAALRPLVPPEILD
ncbi:substrate-binding periplasmic protein [Gimibacter soli]|uniref:Transporter substrate-binding domain-containing protein n=1 Tax=Gimibacter soli TaxID=3024400 RepID=A0AAF0BLB1_9PROT|nr:transporter substrate-binding domain-containing protein [Gimibacter soli]WCL53927.1 transporter substrate-binding domain-containing protein [Gimibacter soli]